MTSDTLIDLLTRFFAERQDVLMAFLFGSRAVGRESEGSDVDIAVWLATHDEAAVEGVWRDLERLTRQDVDLVVLNDASPQVAWAAMRGARLCVRDEALFLGKMLEISGEAEDMDEFTRDYWRWHVRVREQRKIA